jgi:hypothetical protein
MQPTETRNSYISNIIILLFFYRSHSQIRSHSLLQSHIKDNDMRKLTGFHFSMIIHFHHCYFTISNTVKQAYKDWHSKIGDVVQEGRGSKSHIKQKHEYLQKVVSRKEKINRW